MKGKADLEVECISTLLKAHTDIRNLSTFPFDTKDKVPRAIEDRFDLREWLGVVDLGKQLACRAVLLYQLQPWTGTLPA